jgi:hypothetical protein
MGDPILFGVVGTYRSEVAGRFTYMSIIPDYTVLRKPMVDLPVPPQGPDRGKTRT